MEARIRELSEALGVLTLAHFEHLNKTDLMGLKQAYDALVKAGEYDEKAAMIAGQLRTNWADAERNSPFPQNYNAIVDEILKGGN